MNNYLGQKGIPELGPGLAACAGLLELRLNLRSNFIRGDQFVLLCLELGRLQLLQTLELDFWRNEIDNGSLEVGSGALAQLQSLLRLYLDFENNRINSAGAECLAQNLTGLGLLEFRVRLGFGYPPLLNALCQRTSELELKALQLFVYERHLAKFLPDLSHYVAYQLYDNIAVR